MATPEPAEQRLHHGGDWGAWRIKVDQAEVGSTGGWGVLALPEETVPVVGPE